VRITLKKIVASVILVILVISTFAALSTPHVKAQTTETVITSYSWYTAPSNTVLATYAGDLVAVGEVENSGTTTLGMIYISGEALNSSGAILCPSEVPVLALPLLPGEKAPFYMDFNPAESINPEDMSESWIANVTNVTLRVTIADATNQTQYTGLTTTNLNGFDNSGVYTVTGDVENTGSQTPQNVWVATTFYNSAGKVIGLNYTAYLTPPPSPGNSVPFVATPTDNSATLSNEVKSYSVLVLSPPQSSSSATPQPTSSSSTPPPTSPSSSTQPKQTQAPMNSLVTYGIIAAVVIFVAALAALTLFRTRRNKGQFEPPPPPPPPPP
jgi:hypothetical protein